MTIHAQIPPGKSLKPGQAAQIGAAVVESPDPHITNEINLTLKMAVPLDDRVKTACNILLGWLVENGEFIRSESDFLYYFYDASRQLMNIDGCEFWTLLAAVTDVNPATSKYKQFLSAVTVAAQGQEKRKIVKLAHWDKLTKTLRVSRFDGTVYRLDGGVITDEPNGVEVIFDDRGCEPYKPDLHDLKMFDKLCDANFDDPTGNLEMYQLAFGVWQLATFFSELQPTKPALVVLGEKGSGKSMMLRRFLKLLFGSDADISGAPDQPDDFIAAATNNHILAIDNLDQFKGFLRDKIATMTTGGIDQVRRLYTENESFEIKYRTWLAFTSRTPDTLQRDDLADRLVILPVRRITDSELIAERAFLEDAENNRSLWWGALLVQLNYIVAAIREGKLQVKSNLRMADFESLGRLIAEVKNKESVWNTYIDALKKSQIELLIKDNLIFSCLTDWMSIKTNNGREISSGDLYDEIVTLCFANGIPRRFPKDAAWFGRKLSAIEDALRLYYDVDKYTTAMTTFWTFTERH
jgi:hypothetical protein